MWQTRIQVVKIIYFTPISISCQKKREREQNLHILEMSSDLFHATFKILLITLWNSENE